jgi:hypothetical protein
MTQNAPKEDAASLPAHDRPVLGRISRALAGGAGVLALTIPMASQDAMAQGWQITTQYGPGVRTSTLRKLGTGDGSTTQLKNGPAPGNDCPGSAFEVMNPRPGEFRCVGYVARWWWPSP